MATVDESIQWIIDNAQSLTIDGRGVVASTVSRSGVVRAVSRGGRTWKITVTPAPTLIDQSRAYLSRLDQVDRIQVATIDFNHAGFEDFFQYQGDASGTFTGNTAVGEANQLSITASSYTSGYVVRAGDYIQIGSTGHLYQVVDDPATGNGATVTVNRPIDEADGSYTLNVGQNCTLDVICVSRPTWSITATGARHLIEWSGDFVFYEDRT